MAVRSAKQGLAATNDYNVDLSFLNKSRLRGAIKRLGALFRFGWLSNKNNDYSPNKEVNDARDAQLSNMNNMATAAHVYSRRF